MTTKRRTWALGLLAGIAGLSLLPAEDRAPGPPQSPPPLTADIRLTGIATLPPAPRAFFVIAEPGLAPENKVVALGTKCGTLEVTGIDAPRGRVSIRYRSVPLELSFSSHRLDEQFYADAAERQFVAEHTRAHEELERRQVAEALRERAAQGGQAAAQAGESKP